MQEREGGAGVETFTATWLGSILEGLGPQPGSEDDTGENAVSDFRIVW